MPPLNLLHDDVVQALRDSNLTDDQIRDLPVSEALSAWLRWEYFTDLDDILKSFLDAAAHEALHPTAVKYPNVEFSAFHTVTGDQIYDYLLTKEIGSLTKALDDTIGHFHIKEDERSRLASFMGGLVFRGPI